MSGEEYALIAIIIIIPSHPSPIPKLTGTA